MLCMELRIAIEGDLLEKLDLKFLMVFFVYTFFLSSLPISILHTVCPWYFLPKSNPYVATQPLSSSIEHNSERVIDRFKKYSY